MHIPENYLSPETCGVMLATAAPFWYLSIRKVEAQVSLHKETIPMLGLSSLIFRYRGEQRLMQSEVFFLLS